MGYGKQALEDFREPLQDLRRRIPSVFEGYGALSKAVFASGALDTKTKELMAVAIAVTKRCDGCVASHTRAAAREGATAQEVAESVGVAILMNGGPGTVYAPKAMEAFLEFEADLN
jgi:AhpD family alkylhydroperoxidase